MRIGVVVHEYPPVEAAGVSLLAKEQADALAGRGHQVAVLARTANLALPDGSISDEIVDGIPVRRVVHNYPVRPHFHEYYDNHLFDALFRAWLEGSRPDLLHVQHLILLSPNLLAVAREQGVPVVLSLHDFFYLCHRIFLLDNEARRCPGPDAGARCVPCLAEHGAADGVRSRFDYMARMLALPDALVAPSRALAERYIAELPFLDGKVEVIEPGLARIPIRRTADPAGAGRYAAEPGRPLKLVFIGTLLPHKGLDLLIAALESFDPVRYELAVHGGEVVGHPAHEEYVRRLRAATQGRPVLWRGPFPPDALDEVLAWGDVLVLPSRCDESYSRVVREARAAGLAVIAPHSGGPGEALRDGVDALLVEPDSRKELAAALSRLIEEPELVKRLREAPAHVSTVNDAAVRLEGLFERVIAARVSSPRPALTALDREPPKVTVAYVTKDGAEFLDESLRAVRAQQGRFELAQLLAIDSGSSDGTLAILQQHGVETIRIAPEEFGHGRTRNLAAERASGDVIVFLTQDASPADSSWLAALLEVLESDPLLAGVWSRHQPRPGCHPMEWRMHAEFPLFQVQHPRISQARGNRDYASRPEHYFWFSNNGSAIRRSVLARWPFPDVEFGEDQAWARAVLEAGWRTALVPQSLIYHSHSYSAWTNLRRNFDHHRAMTRHLAQNDRRTLRDLVRHAFREARRDVAFWASHRGRSRFRVTLRWAGPAFAFHLGAMLGVWLGTRAARIPAPLAARLSLHGAR